MFYCFAAAYLYLCFSPLLKVTIHAFNCPTRLISCQTNEPSRLFVCYAPETIPYRTIPSEQTDVNDEETSPTVGQSLFFVLNHPLMTISD